MEFEFVPVQQTILTIREAVTVLVDREEGGYKSAFGCLWDVNSVAEVYPLTYL